MVIISYIDSYALPEITLPVILREECAYTTCAIDLHENNVAILFIYISDKPL